MSFLIPLICAAAGLLLGGGCAYLVMKNKLTASEKLNSANTMNYESRLADLQKAKDDSEHQLQAHFEQQSAMQKEFHESQLNSLKTEQLRAEQRFQDELNKAERRFKEEQAQTELRFKEEQAQTELRFKEEQTKTEQLRQERNLAMTNEFKNLSEQILKSREESLGKTNQQQVDSLLKPLKDRMETLQRQMDEAEKKNVEFTAGLKAQCENMMKMTEKIGMDANQLARALKGDSKTQGDWGEMILEQLLTDAGLNKDVQFSTQTVLKDAKGNSVLTDDGHTLRTDAIIHYPDGKDVIIDSKVSLTAFTDYTNAVDENQRKSALTEHIRSVRRHVDELVRKAYWTHPQGERDMVDFVIMFIPGESPFQLAVSKDSALWQEAYHKHVLIVSPVNLMALLFMINMTWKRVEQERNQQEILETAKHLLERLYNFYESFDKVGAGLETIGKSYTEAVKRLKGMGNGKSVVATGERLKQLGITPKKQCVIPPRFKTLWNTPDENLMISDSTSQATSEATEEAAANLLREAPAPSASAESGDE